MNFNLEVTLGDVLTLIGFTATGVGLFIALVQMKQNFKVQQAQFLLGITNVLFDDSNLRKFFYKIDYEKFKFDKNNLNKFKGSDEERWLDSLLYHYDSLGKMVRMKLIKLEEVEFLFFEVIQIFRNREVNKYITWLESEYDMHGTVNDTKRKRPHDDARWLFEQISNI